MTARIAGTVSGTGMLIVYNGERLRVQPDPIPEGVAMRSRALALVVASVVSVASVVIAAGVATGAETYTALQGRIMDAESGESQSLTGFFDAELQESGSLDPQVEVVALITDFELQTGDGTILDRQPIEYDGLTPLAYLYPADALTLSVENPILFRLRTGPELVAESEDEVTFRFLDFRSDASDGSRASGWLPGDPFPRRLELRGRLFEVDQTFRIQRADSGIPNDPLALPPPPAGGAIVIGGGGDLSVVSLPPVEPIFVGTTLGCALPIVDLGDIQLGIAQLEASEAMVADGGGGAETEFLLAPTLEELGIIAPDGAEVTLDSEGVLTIRSDGKLFIEGSFPEIEGLTAIVIIGAEIEVTGSLALPPDVQLRLETGGSIVIPGPPVVVGPGLCNGLRPIFPAEEREVGTFSLALTNAQVVEIDVHPGRDDNRVSAGRRGLLPVAILGSDELDVADVDHDSLRLGRGEAEPLSHRRWTWVFQMDVNGDQHGDLLAIFDVRASGIERGDESVCLAGETLDGGAIEGCDAIDTTPRRWWRRRDGRSAAREARRSRWK